MAGHHSTEERDTAVAEMNEPKSECKVLISTYAVGCTGRNLQSASYDGIIVEYPQNIATLIQAIARLPRLGQTKPVT